VFETVEKDCVFACYVGDEVTKGLEGLEMKSDFSLYSSIAKDTKNWANEKKQKKFNTLWVF